jgi:hypothetical protein
MVVIMMRLPMVMIMRIRMMLAVMTTTGIMTMLDDKTSDREAIMIRAR